MTATKAKGDESNNAEQVAKWNGDDADKKIGGLPKEYGLIWTGKVERVLAIYT